MHFEKTTDERLAKILSETQTVITEHNSRQVRGSVEVDARLFEGLIMELQQRRAVVVTIPTICKEYRSGKVCSIYEQAMDEVGVKWRSVDDE